IDARPYKRALDGFAREFAKRSVGLTEELDRGRALARYLGDEVGFRGVADGRYPPTDVFVHRAIETRRGLPLTLTAIYSFVARRVGLRVGVVPLPGHIMLRLYGRRQNLIVDPFHGGEARSQAALMHYLAQHGLAFRSIWFRDADDRGLLLRQIRNLSHSLEIHERHAEVKALRPLLRLAVPKPR
ncbi:MAG: transglutaminase family protein, partial [Planctomycetes bacterium]|nr:transglutaminase family protein [Planctomycetota bacterium]